MATDEALSYREALALVLQTATASEPEEVPLLQACGRVAATHISAVHDDPGYDQSLRDGFVVGGKNLPDEDGYCRFRLLGEIPAGCGAPLTVGPGETYRIMTGAPIPRGGELVLPREWCRREADLVIIGAEVLAASDNHVQKQGEAFSSGERLVTAGTRLQPYHLGLLGIGGIRRLKVHRRPVLAVCCSGSELVQGGDLRPGLKFSSNRYLLRGLLQSEGAEAWDLGTVADRLDSLGRLFERIKTASVEALVTTGGMGPGKYDLLEQAFGEAGGRTIFRSLRVTPGKRLLFGTMNGRLYFGLPGPPTAVRVLFQELVTPALRRMAGLNRVGPRSLQATLEHDLVLPGRDLYHLKEGVLRCRGTGFTVRLAGRFEAPDCLLQLPEGVERYHSGDRLTVHLGDGPEPVGAGEAPPNLRFPYEWF